MWKDSRPIFLDAVQSLLACSTPEQFQSLSRPRIWHTIMILNLPNVSLREVTVEAVVRCGDNRTLEALKNLRRLGSMEITNTDSPLHRLFYQRNPMWRFLQKEGAPLATEESKNAIDRAIAGLKERLDEIRREAQLLRASDRDSVPAGRELVRAAVSPGAATSAEELVRPSPDAEG